MKSSKLIELIRDADPTGEVEVCIGNADIFNVERLPAYYDGNLQVLVRDESLEYYNVKGAKYYSSGDKVQINTLCVSDALFEDPENFVIDYSDLNEEKAARLRENHESHREWCRDLENTSELELFIEWVKEQSGSLCDDIDELKAVATRFFEKNVSYKDPLPEGGIPLNMSYNTCRKMQWSEKFTVLFESGFLKVAEKC